uniref:hypothetical protein n=1 Tax=Brucella pseudintermedia TaxID=370111 RepID=UPI001F2A3B34|nr:hypothetical protein [Brucella pseudintermedia]
MDQHGKTDQQETSSAGYKKTAPTVGQPRREKGEREQKKDGGKYEFHLNQMGNLQFQ